MTFLHFQPASSKGWFAIAAAPRLLVLSADTSDSTLDAAFDALGSDRGLQAALELLTARGLSSMPAFALVEWPASGDALRAILRGELELDVVDAAGQHHQISGAGVSTWTERNVAAAASATLELSGAVTAEGRSLPLESGVAYVASLVFGGTSARQASSSQASQTGQASQTSQTSQTSQASPAAPVTEPVAHAKAPASTPAPSPAAAEAASADGIDESTITESAIEEATIAGATDAPAPDGAETDAEGYDYLFGATVFRNVADAAVREDVVDEDAALPAEPAAAQAPDDVDEDTGGMSGDHDGETVLTSDVAKLRVGRKSKRAASRRPIAPPAPKLVLQLPSGEREPLNQPILVGRAPSVSKVSGGQLPRLLVVGGADQDISRNHAQFALEGDTVVVTDLHSRNGTRVVMPGKEPQLLRAGEPTSVIIGTVIDLGGGITLTVGED